MMTLRDRIEEIADDNNDETPGWLVSIYTSKWSPTKSANQLAKEAAVAHKADEKYVSARVDKIEKGALKAWTQVESMTRSMLDKHCIPYGKTRGVHFLPAENAIAFGEDNRKVEEAAKAARKTIESIWEDQIAIAEKALGDLFVASDYPSVHQIGKRYVYGCSVTPMSTKKPSRPKSKILTEEQINELDAWAIKSQQEAVSQVSAGILAKFVEPKTGVLTHMIERLSAFKVEYDPETNKLTKSNSFHDSLVENIEDLLKIVPVFNVTGDPTVTAFCDEIREKLTVIPATQLRTSAHDRREVLENAKAIYDKINDKMSLLV